MKAFISSTSIDLGDYRQAAYEVCNRLSIVPIGMEQFESMGVGATAGSRKKIDEADVYVGIVANRYGFIEPGFDRSVTELEFDHAAARGLERLCFVADPAAALPIYPDDQDKLAAFRERVRQLVGNTFTTAWEFKYKLYDSLLKWLFRSRSGSPLTRRVFDPLFAEYARFGGRAEALARIRNFVDAPEPGYLVITAPAGYGKTALALRLVELNRDVAAYHFFTTLYGTGSEFLSEPFFVRNVVEQLRLWHYTPYTSWQTPDTLSGWVSAYQELIATRLEETRLLVIDGLDEIRGWQLRPYLALPPATGLKIVVCLRDVGQPWLEEYGFPKTHVQHLALGGLEPADVAELLRLTGPRAAAFADDAGLLGRLIAVTTPPGTLAGSDPLHLVALADDIEAGHVTPATLDEQPTRLEDYLQRWWQELLARAAHDSAALDLLGTLAAALGPIGRADLIALHPALKPGWTADPLRKAIGEMRRTIAGDDERGYTFAHPRFRAYLRRFDEVKAYEERLLAWCKDVRIHKGRYALAWGVAEMARAGDTAALFEIVLDENFQAAQRAAFGSIQPALEDLARAATIACESDRFIDVLRCVGQWRRLAQGEGLSQSIFADVEALHFETAGQKAAWFGAGVKASGAWLMALRCWLIREAALVGQPDAASDLVKLFGRQLGLRYLGAALHTSDLCDVMIAGAIDCEPGLAAEIGVDPAWAPALLANSLSANPAPAPAGGDPATRRAELELRIGYLESMIGENPSLVEFIDEERAGDYTMRLRDALVELADDPAIPGLIDRALAVVSGNPYPRYRDNALVSLAIAALAVSDPAWSAPRLRSILEIGLEREGVTFTFDLAAQLLSEAEHRGIAAAGLASYLDQAASANDRWGTRLRCLSAKAGAEFAQGRTTEAQATIETAAGSGEGFSGYLSAHLLALASRCCETNAQATIDVLDLLERSRSLAERVRDPAFRVERLELVERFGQWLKAPVPDWQAVASLLRTTADADARRACKDLASARWSALERRDGWSQLLQAALRDATALDFVLGRLAARTIRQHRDGSREFSDGDLAEAIAICETGLATARSWEFGAPMYG